MSSVVDDVCELLESYSGRDKVVRLACYSFKLYGCVRKNEAWQKASSNLSHARMMLRLFDDIPMIKYAYNYGLGQEESSFVSSLLGVLANVVDTAYMPVEKALWFQDMGVLKLSAQVYESLDTLSTVLWFTSIYIALLQTLRSMQQLWWSQRCLSAAAEGTGEAGGGVAARSAGARLALRTASAVKLCLDLTHAGSCLPAGALWGARLPAATVAAVATSSSLIGLALYFANKRFLK